jgi:hypothetical protein
VRGDDSARRPRECGSDQIVPIQVDADERCIAQQNEGCRNVGGLGDQVQVIGTCTFRGSYQQGGSPSDNAVGFENPTGATPSYRLTKASPVGDIRDAFDCNDIDFERDARPSPVGGKCDFGADEYRENQ